MPRGQSSHSFLPSAPSVGPTAPTRPICLSCAWYLRPPFHRPDASRWLATCSTGTQGRGRGSGREVGGACAGDRWRTQLPFRGTQDGAAGAAGANGRGRRSAVAGVCRDVGNTVERVPGGKGDPGAATRPPAAPCHEAGPRGRRARAAVWQGVCGGKPRDDAGAR